MFMTALRHFWMLFQYCWVLSSQLEKRSSNIQLKHQCLPMDLRMTKGHQLASSHLIGSWWPFRLIWGFTFCHLPLTLIPSCPLLQNFAISSAGFVSPGSSWLALHLSTLFNVISSERFFPLSSLKYASIHPHPSTMLWYSQVPLGLLSLPYLSWIVYTFIVWYPFITCSFYFCSLSSIMSRISLLITILSAMPSRNSGI